MSDPVLIETYGDAVNLRILNFFMENPFDDYAVAEIARFSSASRNSVYKYLDIFTEKGYLTAEEKQSGKLFRLNRASRMVQLIDGFVESAGSIVAGPIARRPPLPSIEPVCAETTRPNLPMIATTAR